MLRLFLIALLLYALLLGGGYAYLYRAGIIRPGFFEHLDPVIVLEHVPDGIGAGPAQFRLRVSDAGAGLESVLVRAQQAKRKIDLFSKSYPVNAPGEDEIEFSVAGQEQGLREGNVLLTVRAFDRSFFSNKTTKTLELPVDYRKPRLEVLSAQHNVNQGGVEFAFYKLMDGTAVQSGVQVGEQRFPGVPARLLNPGFEDMPEVFFSFFAVPSTYNAEGDAVTAFAANRVGNVNLAPFYHHLIPHRFRKSEVPLGAYYLRSKLEELYLNYGKAAEDLPLDEASLAALFAKTLQSLHRAEDKDFLRFSGESVQQQLWKVPFQRPVGGGIKTAFGERLHFTCNGNDAGEEVHGGVDLATSLRNSVYAVNDGKVAYAGYFGSYGNTVIIDHGFALFSLYGHLSSVKVEAGQMVQQGAEIGRSGTSGFASGDHLHFEMRLREVPVNPAEWWDTRWINDHIVAKVHQILGQHAAQPAGEAESED